MQRAVFNAKSEIRIFLQILFLTSAFLLVAAAFTLRS